MPEMSGGLVNGERKEQEQENDITRKVYENINAGGHVYLTSTVVKGAYAIRVVSANELADEEHIQKAFEVLIGRDSGEDARRNVGKQSEGRPSTKWEELINKW